VTTSEVSGRRRPVGDRFGGALSDAYLLDLDVVGVDELAPHVRKVTVSSPDLIGFSFLPGQDLMIEFPNGDSTVPRRYTIRRANPQAGTADLEFELHGGDGIAERWASAAPLGSRLDAIGPRGKISIQSEAKHHVFVADDSAMPATFAMLEALPAHATAAAILVTPHGPHSRPATTSKLDGATVWVDESDLSRAIAALGVGPGVAIYVNGERQLVGLAVELFSAAGVPRERIANKPYWRRDQPNAANGEPSRD
jgi:NADPH-dependent ferric siderophore reductase